MNFFNIRPNTGLNNRYATELHKQNNNGNRSSLLRPLALSLVLSTALFAGCASTDTGNSTAEKTTKAQTIEANAKAEKTATATAKTSKPKPQRKTKTGEMNPAPSVAFNGYSHFVLEEVTIAERFAAHSANQKALAKIREEMDLRIGATIKPWQQGKNKTLVIKPHVKEIKFISGKARFWAGALAGKSFVLLTVDFVDQATGKVIASPEFYQHANAFGGAWSIGATDNNMLIRIAELTDEYVAANYVSAVGGLTGR